MRWELSGAASMRKKRLCSLMVCLAFASCANEAARDDSSSEDDSTSGAEMPAGMPLALDSIHNVRVVEHGLQFDDGYYYACDSSGQRWVPSTHRYRTNDTALFNPIIKGFGAANGKVSISPSYIVRAADGRVIYNNVASKYVSRFREDEARFATFLMPVAWLDSLTGSHTASHYDVEYTLKDRITGKSLEGIYRIHINRD